MLSTIDSFSSTIRDNATVGDPLGTVLVDCPRSGGYSRGDIVEISPAFDYAFEDGLILVVAVPPEPVAVLVPEDTSRPPGSSRLDKLYEPEFQRLEAALEALKELERQQQRIVALPEALEGNGAPQIRVPSSVTEGYMPMLGVLDGKDVGGVVFGSVLVDRQVLSRK